MSGRFHALISATTIFTLCVTTLMLIVIHPCFAQQGEWTWMKGSSTNNGIPVYGTQGVPNVTNTPAAMYEPIEWTDHDGNFWLFGGLKDFGNEYNTMWKFEPATNEWTWVKGSTNCCQAGVYGTQGVPSINNIPGARTWGGCSWVDTAGHLWLFGGIGEDGQGGYQVLSDLWMYDIATNEWTWMYGPNNGTVAPTYGTIGVPAATNHPGARAESNASWTDTHSNLWMFGGALYFPQAGGWSLGGFGNDMWEFKTDDMLWVWMKGTTALSGSGIYGTKGVPSLANYPPGRGSYAKWSDSNDDLWLFGGYNLGSAFNDVWRYDIPDNTWTWMSGSNTANSNGTAGTQCVPDSDNAPSSRYENRMFWLDDDGNFWVYGGIRTDFNNSVLNDLWQYNPVMNEWTYASGSLLNNQAGNYGTVGVSSPANMPPAKFGGVAWKDTDGNLWTFGGSSEIFFARNDLWRFVPDPACPQAPVQPINFGAAATEICEKFCTDFFDSSSNNPTSWLWLFPGGGPASSTDQNPANICYNNSGTYDVTLITTGANGSDTLVLSGFITVYPTPSIPTVTQNGYILTCSPATTYQWQLNSSDIPGATNQSYSITQTGLYSVSITDQNGCISASPVLYVQITGIEDLITGEGVSIFPNPAEESITITLSNVLLSDIMHILIYNTLGQLVFSSEEKIESSEFSKIIDVHELPAGVYYLELKNGSDRIKRKFMLTK